MELGDPSVNYTTKELLARIEASVRDGNARLEQKIDQITLQLGAKLDKVELAPVLQRLAIVESAQERQALTEVQRNAPMLAKGERYMEKVDTLEKTAATAEALMTYRKWLVGAFATAMASAIAVVTFALSHVRFGR